MKIMNGFTMIENVKYVKFIHSLVKVLRIKGFKASLHYISKRGSGYIQFEEKNIGKIRVSEYPDTAKYKYRFNVRFDIERSYRDGYQYFYTIEDLDTLYIQLKHRKTYYS